MRKENLATCSLFAPEITPAAIVEPLREIPGNSAAACQVPAPRPYRLHLKSGKVSRDLGKELNITGVYGREIEGGAGILLDIPLDDSKELKGLTLETLSNDVVIGIMGITLQ